MNPDLFRTEKVYNAYFVLMLLHRRKSRPFSTSASTGWWSGRVTDVNESTIDGGAADR